MDVRVILAAACYFTNCDNPELFWMDWIQVLTVFAVIATNLGTIIALYVHSDRKIDDNRKDTNALLEAIRQDIKAIANEMKDFHGRLCAIEERKKS